MIDLAGVGPVALVGLGGALGAVLRTEVSARLAFEGFPLGTLAVNASGTFLLGLVTVAAVGQSTVLLAGIGFCGAFTTFSSFAAETIRLWETGRPRVALVNAVGNLAAAGVGFLGALLLVR